MHSDMKENLLSKTKKEGSNIKVTNVSHIRLDKSQRRRSRRSRRGAEHVVI